MRQTSYFASVASRPHPKPISPLEETDPDPYPTKEAAKEADMLLWNAYRPSTFLRTAKTNTERVYSLTVHPDPERVLVFCGDKRGIVGVWDANARDEETDGQDEGSSVKREVKDEDEDDKAGIVRDWRSGSGKVWRMQVHQRSAISCLKVDPTRGDTVSVPLSCRNFTDSLANQLFSSAYDCSIRTISLLTGLSSAIYALPDGDALINHFDISPSGKEIWAVDSLGGLNHVDMREDDKQWGRRRWVISGQNTNTKIGGIGIDRESFAARLALALTAL
jgi:WD40 repeat protein